MKTFLFYLWNLTNDITTHLWLKQISVSIQTLFNQHSLLEKNWSPTFPNLNLIIRGLPLFLPVARQELLHWPWALTGVLEENSINITRYTVCTHGHKQTDRQLHRPVKQTLQTGCKHTWICFIASIKRRVRSNQTGTYDKMKLQQYLIIILTRWGKRKKVQHVCWIKPSKLYVFFFHWMIV